MNDKPLVTVFIAAYNCEQYIQETLDSIVNQTYTNLEILIIDDGSTDETIREITAFKDNRIRLYRNKLNKGIPYTRNKGLEYSNGEFIAIIDADDIAVKNRIEIQVNYMLNNPSIDVLGTFYKTLGNKFQRIIKTKYNEPNEIRCHLLFYNNIANPTIIIRKDFLEKNSIKYNENYFVAQDYKLWSKVIKHGNIAILKKALTKYRVGHGNITRESKNNQNKALKRKHLIDMIHIDLINYYGFDLNKHEISEFNLFFTDNIVESVEIDEILIIQIIRKLLEQNNQESIFNSGQFQSILSHCVLLSLKKHDMKIEKKMRIWDNISDIVNMSKFKGKLILNVDYILKKLKEKLKI